VVKLDQMKDKREKEEAAAMLAKLKDWKSKNKGSGNDKSGVTCFNCDKVGHIAKDCWAEGGGAHKKGKKRGRGKQAKEEDNDSEDFAYSAIGAQAAFKVSGGGKQICSLDSGATCHFEPDQSSFVNIRACNPYVIEMADGQSEKATEVGDIQFQCLHKGKPRTIKLTNVYYTPWMSNGLISITQLWKSGVYFCNKSGFGVLTEIKSGKEVLQVKATNEMYAVETWKLGSAMSTSLKQKSITIMEAHACLGHIC
jgi:hypothetical protein